MSFAVFFLGGIYATSLLATVAIVKKKMTPIRPQMPYLKGFTGISPGKIHPQIIVQQMPATYRKTLRQNINYATGASTSFDGTNGEIPQDLPVEPLREHL